jgi:hypothetical protein
MWVYQWGEWGGYKHLAEWFEVWARLEARVLLLTKPILTDPHSCAIWIGVDHPPRSGASVKDEWICTSVYLHWDFNGEILHYCSHYYYSPPPQSAIRVLGTLCADVLAGWRDEVPSSEEIPCEFSHYWLKIWLLVDEVSTLSLNLLTIQTMVTTGILPHKENPHGRAGNRTRHLVISSQKLWPLDHEAGHSNYWGDLLLRTSEVWFDGMVRVSQGTCCFREGGLVALTNVQSILITFTFLIMQSFWYVPSDLSPNPYHPLHS